MPFELQFFQSEELIHGNVCLVLNQSVKTFYSVEMFIRPQCVHLPQVAKQGSAVLLAHGVIFQPQWLLDVTSKYECGYFFLSIRNDTEL